MPDKVTPAPTRLAPPSLYPVLVCVRRRPYGKKFDVALAGSVKSVVVTKAELKNFRRFNVCCVDQLNRVFLRPKQDTWEAMVSRALARAEGRSF